MRRSVAFALWFGVAAVLILAGIPSASKPMLGRFVGVLLMCFGLAMMIYPFTPLLIEACGRFGRRLRRRR